MANSDHDQLSNKLDLLWSATSGLLISTNLLRWIGYGLLVLAVFDLITIFVPPNFTNPVWEFQTLGSLVEQVAVPLIGVAFVLTGEREVRRKWEWVVLKYVSWSSLLVGVLFLLLIPLGIFNTMRIDQLNNQQITTRVNQGISQIQQVQNQLEGVATIEQMEALLSRLDRGGLSPDITGTDQLATMKQQLAKFLDEGEGRLNTQAKATRSTQKLRLLKNSVKWNLGALISGMLFLGVWRGTPWARRSR